MKAVITGAYGRVGTALLDYQSQGYKYVPFDRQSHPRLETRIGDITDYKQVKGAFSDGEAVVHLAADPNVNAAWESILQNNIFGAYKTLEACRECNIETVVLGSSNHVVGMYERDNAPKLYDPDYDLKLDHHSPVRPDSPYGVSKVFLEALGRYYVEEYEYPEQVYVLRIGSVRYPKYDHPYGDAETGVDEGEWERGSEDYKRAVRRMKATWHSRRDIAALVECCLDDESVTFDIFYGVSDNERRWFDIDHARTVVGYDPQDSADDWESPPPNPGDVDTTAFDC